MLRVVVVSTLLLVARAWVGVVSTTRQPGKQSLHPTLRHGPRVLWATPRANDAKDGEDDNNLVDWDGIGGLDDSMRANASNRRTNLVPSTGNVRDETPPLSTPRNDRDVPSATLSETPDSRAPSPSKRQRDDSDTVKDPPVVDARKFTGASLFSEPRRPPPTERKSVRDEMMQREFNLAGWFERTLPLQASFIAVALVFVIYTSQQPHDALLPSFDTTIDDSLLPDFWSQFQDGTNRVDVEEIGKASGESVFI